jgi:hypothetical protein
MLRTQIQLTEAQAAKLRRRAAREKVSVAELIRRSIDQTLDAPQPASPDRRRQKALEIVGAFASGQPDLARQHDDALAEAFQ